MKPFSLRLVPAAAALAVASFAFNAFAQGTGPAANPPAPGNASGEQFPNPSNTRSNPAPKPAVVQKVEDSKAVQTVNNSRPVKATKRGVKRAKNATVRAANRTKDAIANTGERIGDKLPPARQ